MTTAACSPIDQQALEQLYLQLEKRLYNVVYRWVWDREEARELVQEAFVRLWRMRTRVEAATVQPLIFRIALNLAANRRRWRRLWRLTGLDRLGATASTQPAADETLEERERRLALRAAVDRLPERLRRVITLCELGGMSYAEVANVLKIPPGTVASRRNAALSRLRQVLSGRAPAAAEEGNMRPELDPAEAFAPLEPPAGGLPALRARLERDRVSQRRARALFLGVGALATAAILIWMGRSPRERGHLIEAAAAEHYPSLAARGLTALPSEPVTVLSPAVRLRRVPVSSPWIVFYLARADQR